MITCTLNGKKVHRGLHHRAARCGRWNPRRRCTAASSRSRTPPSRARSPEDAKELSIGEAMDVMIRWFCILFGNQFTPDDVLDHYPVDRLMHDIALALMAVQTQTTEILDEFPTKAAKTEAPAATA